MKVFFGALATFICVSAFGLQVAMAADPGSPGEEISGGGQILEDDGSKISFGVYGLVTLTGYEGSLEVNFHKVDDPWVVKTKFHGEEITAMQWFPGQVTCNAALNMTVFGYYDGEPGWKVIFRAGDYDAPGAWDAEAYDTIRVTLYDPDGNVYYETSDKVGGVYESSSTCQGTARTKLDRGNVTIESLP